MGAFVESLITPISPSELVGLMELTGNPPSFQAFLNNVKVVITQTRTSTGQSSGGFNPRAWAPIDSPGRWQVIYDEYITNPAARKMNTNEKITRANGDVLVIVFHFDHPLGQILYCNEDLSL